jgi:hypothetical protein
VLNSVSRKRLVKTEDFYVWCGYSDNWSVYVGKTVITVLKSVARKRLVKTEIFLIH